MPAQSATRAQWAYMAQLTLAAATRNLTDLDAGTPRGYSVRSSDTQDARAIGCLYFASYKPGQACDTLEEAISDVEASFAGAYGEYWFEASPVVEHDGSIVAAVMTVRRAPWDDVPDCPFIIELLTAPDHRRRGLARLLLVRTAQTTSETDEKVALRVDSGNTPAVRLYECLGFAAIGD